MKATKRRASWSLSHWRIRDVATDDRCKGGPPVPCFKLYWNLTRVDPTYKSASRMHVSNENRREEEEKQQAHRLPLAGEEPEYGPCVAHGQ